MRNYLLLSDQLFVSVFVDEYRTNCKRVRRNKSDINKLGLGTKFSLLVP